MANLICCCWICKMLKRSAEFHVSLQEALLSQLAKAITTGVFFSTHEWTLSTTFKAAQHDSRRSWNIIFVLLHSKHSKTCVLARAVMWDWLLLWHVRWFITIEHVAGGIGRLNALSCHIFKETNYWHSWVKAEVISSVCHKFHICATNQHAISKMASWKGVSWGLGLYWNAEWFYSALDLR